MKKIFIAFFACAFALTGSTPNSSTAKTIDSKQNAQAYNTRTTIKKAKGVYQARYASDEYQLPDTALCNLYPGPPMDDDGEPDSLGNALSCTYFEKAENPYDSLDYRGFAQ